MTEPQIASSGRTTQPSRLFVVVFIAAWFGVNLAVSGISGAAAPKALAFLDEETKDARLAMIAAAGGIVLLIITPLFGQLSDRTRSRFGRRRPWMVGGTLVGLGGVVALAFSTELITMMASWCVVQMGFGATNVAQHALLAEQIPARIRARVSGATGVAGGVALIAGATIVSTLPNDQRPLWFIIPGAIGAALSLLLVVVLRDQPPRQAPPAWSWRSLASTYWISPVRHRDFAWAWWCRLLVTLGMVSALLYMLYFITDRLGIPLEQASAAQTQALIGYFVGCLVAAAVAGWASDRTGRRKPIVFAATLITAVGLLSATAATDLSGFLLAMTLVGIGQGSFIAVDIALMTELLPEPQHAGKDLGVVALSYQLPQVLVPIVATPILAAAGGYGALYATAAVLVLAGGLAVLPVRSAR